jgi:hypothetical protein
MDRRLVIAIGYLVLALAVLAVAGLRSPAGAPAAAGVARLPQPAPCPMTERPQALSVLPGAAVAALQLPNGMSGEFANIRYAAIGAQSAPSIYIPSDGWRFTPRRLHRATLTQRAGGPAC